MQEAKQEVIEFVEYLKTPQKYSQLGARIPKVTTTVMGDMVTMVTIVVCRVPCYMVPQEQARPCWLGPLHQKPMFRSCPLQDQTLWRCMQVTLGNPTPPPPPPPPNNRTYEGGGLVCVLYKGVNVLVFF